MIRISLILATVSFLIDQSRNFIVGFFLKTFFFKSVSSLNLIAYFLCKHFFQHNHYWENWRSHRIKFIGRPVALLAQRTTKVLLEQNDVSDELNAEQIDAMLHHRSAIWRAAEILTLCLSD